MMPNAIALDAPLSLRVALPGRVIEFNLADELRIDPGNLAEELRSQPAKYAMVATLEDLASKKLEKVSKDVLNQGGECESSNAQYSKALSQYNLLSRARKAFFHRKTALLGLRSNPKDLTVLEEYHRNLLNLGH